MMRKLMKWDYAASVAYADREGFKVPDLWRAYAMDTLVSNALVPFFSNAIKTIKEIDVNVKSDPA